MDKVRYVKEVNSVVQEYFEILSYQIDYSNKLIQSVISRLKIVNGYPEVKQYSYTITDIYDTTSIYQVDPTWNENSTPPKPAGFILEDPETWGGLSWEQIPKIIPNKNYFSDLFSYIQASTQTPTYMAIETFIINTLVAKGDLPAASEGWALKTITVDNIW